MIGFAAPVLSAVLAAAPITRAAAEGLRPETLLSVSAWADAHRRLPKKSSAEPGPWRTSRTPYLREIMDSMSATSPVEEVVLMKAAQVGGSEAILNTAGYVIDHMPGPMMLVQPTVELGKRFSRQRLEPLIAGTPRLAEKIAPSRTRDSGNTTLSKEFPGGVVIVTGANSAVGLRSMPAQYLFLDEIDGYPLDVDEEGSPIALAEARQRTFARKKRMKVSTPTIQGRSAIESAYEGSDRRRYYVPCPHCEELQPLEFPHLKFDEANPAAAVYICRACGCEIPEHHKTEMFANGQWVAEAPERSGKTRGYHLNALYAPIGWMSWGEIATQFVKVKKDPDQLRVFVNTVLGETWKDKGEAPEWEILKARAEDYERGVVPAGAVLLTAGVDVQADRLVLEIVGWGRGKQSWSVDYRVIPGNTSDLERGPWVQLDAILNTALPHAHGSDIPISIMAVDSGYNSQVVYQWTRRYPLNRVMAVDGRTLAGMILGQPSPVEVTIGGKRVKRGARVWPVGTNVAKTELYGWLRLEPPADGAQYPAGYCHFPHYEDDYFKQLTSEQIVAHKTKRGFIKLEWEVIFGRQNHVLDARVYARAAAELARIGSFGDAAWSTLEDAVRTKGGAPAPNQPTPSAPQPAMPAAAAPVIPNRRPTWLGQRNGGWLRGGR